MLMRMAVLGRACVCAGCIPSRTLPSLLQQHMITQHPAGATSQHASHNTRAVPHVPRDCRRLPRLVCRGNIQIGSRRRHCFCHIGHRQPEAPHPGEPGVLDTRTCSCRHRTLFDWRVTRACAQHACAYRARWACAGVAFCKQAARVQWGTAHPRKKTVHTVRACLTDNPALPASRTDHRSCPLSGLGRTCIHTALGPTPPRGVRRVP